MAISQTNLKRVAVRLATNADEVRAAQRLRYNVFYEEYAAKPDAVMAQERRDADDFDDVADHLIVLDESLEGPGQRIVGTYRLIRKEAAEKYGRFYTSGEYDIAPLLDNWSSVLELGRSCVLADYRTRPVLQLLWEGIVGYAMDNDIDLLFGCASLCGTDTAALSKQLAYLHHYHLTPAGTCPRAVPGRYVDMNLHAKEDIDQRAQFAALPPLIKGYLRAGATIGDGAVIDEQFNTTDVCIVLPTARISARYRNHYERKLGRALPGASATGRAAAEFGDGFRTLAGE